MNLADALQIATHSMGWYLGLQRNDGAGKISPDGADWDFLINVSLRVLTSVQP
jgi:hypothetical protein